MPPQTVDMMRQMYTGNYNIPAGVTAGGSVTPQPTGQGTFWRGADGNVWVAGAGGTNAAGAWDNQTQNYWTSRGYAEQTDPNAPEVTDLRATGRGTGVTYKNTDASRDATQTSINSLDTILNNALTGADTEYQSVKDAYAIEDAANLAKYEGDVQKNEITRDESTQAGLLAAARGSRGLYATLASIGALGGTGRLQANRAIATEANADLGAGEKSFETNAGTLFDARSGVKKKEDQRKLDAEQTWKDSRQNAEYENLSQNQKLSQEMAGYWSDAGNTGEANNWISRASGYTPQLAAKTKVNPAKYAKDPLEYAAPALSKYLGGMNSTAVNVAGGSPVNGALYTSTRKKDELS